MFTGIVERTGKVAEVRRTTSGAEISVEAGEFLRGLARGGSIAVNGCCVTATEFDEQIFRCDLMSITLERTNLGDLKAGDEVNLERPLRLGEELGGHLVQGHVEGVGEVIRVIEGDEDRKLTIRIPSALVRYVIKTGSIAIDGVSLTVAEIEEDLITIGIIPHTWTITNFHNYKPGTRVNVESDFLAKHIEKLLEHAAISNGNETRIGTREGEAVTHV